MSMTPKRDAGEAQAARELTEFEVVCLQERGRILRGRYAHYCDDWDGLTVDETCDEWDTCTCFPDSDLDALMRGPLDGR
jgi:hypothetical protein